MKKGYQKRLNKLSDKFNESVVTSGARELDEIPELEELDQILELPQPLREMSLVKAICDSHRRRRKTVQVAKNQTSPNPVLSVWQETSTKSLNYNSRN